MPVSFENCILFEGNEVIIAGNEIEINPEIKIGEEENN